mmetsp:Transcript_77323/g.151424  ORF Transcript_77323/g.151424 Transcript_77323/m.151424 type:complete len:426 (-) Transcript_77323:746-2023(-)
MATESTSFLQMEWMLNEVFSFLDVYVIPSFAASSRSGWEECCQWARRVKITLVGHTSDEGSALLQLQRALERSLLLEFFDATNGPGWNRKGFWKECSFPGPHQGVVTSSITGLVTALSLERVDGLEGPLLPLLGRFGSLTSIVAFSTKLRGRLPGAAFSKLSRLRRLRLNNTLVSGPIPAEMCRGLGALRELWLNDTLLSGFIPEEISCLSSLELLDLSASENRRSSLRGGIPESLCRLKNLRRLWLQRTQVTGPLPSTIGELTNLTHLYAFETHLEGEIPESIATCSNLAYLHLSATNVCGVFPRALATLGKLEELYLSSTQLEGPLPNDLSALRNLKRLWLSDCSGVSGPLPSSIGDCVSLRYLCLNGTALSGALPPSMASLEMLQELHLHDTAISGLELGAIWGYKSPTLNALCKRGCAIVI